MPKLAEVRKSASKSLASPVVKILARTGVSPNILTWTGFVFTAVAGLLILRQEMLLAGAVVLFAGFFDMLDGTLARLTGKVTRFGGVLDSTLDRLAEAVLMLCLITSFAINGSVFGVVLTGIGLVGSFLVSYLRARIEALGLTCQEVGLFTRSERIIVLAAGLLLAQISYVLYITLGIIAFFSLFTAVQRLLYARRQTSKNIE